MGFLHAPVSFELVRSLHTMLDGIRLDAVNHLLSEMADEARAVVNSGAPDLNSEETRTAFMRYRGQGHEIEIALPARKLQSEDLANLRMAFDKAYAAQFSRAVPGMEIEILNWSVRVSTPETASPAVPRTAQTSCTSSADMREITCDVTGMPVQATIHHRDKLPHGGQITGPALIVEPQTTTFVGRDWIASSDEYGNLHLLFEPATAEDAGRPIAEGDWR